MVSLGQPIALLLLVPLAVVLCLRPPPAPALRLLRLGLLCLTVLAVGAPKLRLPSRGGTVIVVADRSESMPADSAALQKAAIARLRAAMPAGDSLGVVSFGRRAVIECPPQAGEFAGFIGEVGPDQSRLADGLDLALSLIPAEGSGRLLILSDGQWTGTSPEAASVRAASRRVGLDYQCQRRTPVNDVCIARVRAPQLVAPRQSYLLTAWVQAPVARPVAYRLRRGTTVLAAGERELGRGLSRLLFRDTAGEPGVLSYTVEVTAGPEDPVPENNSARVLVAVEGPRPVLCVNGSGQSGLVARLRAGGVTVNERVPDACGWGIEDLARYAAVILENVPADAVGTPGLEALAAWVPHLGTGLVLTGGRRSYGQGGYYRSPLEAILPVSMELRKEHRKLRLAIVVALDRSGSMAMAAGGGRTKMDLADLGTVQVLDLLVDGDQFGVIAVDSSPHLIVDLCDVAEAHGKRGRILGIDSLGGGIFIYVALEKAAGLLAKATAGTRHIILFADAADSEEPGAYVELLERCRAAGVTVSVVGLGTPQDVDANLLQDIAERGQGRCLFTASPAEIPRLFAQDTFEVARSAFVEEPTAVAAARGYIALTGRDLGPLPAVGGYNLCYLRPGATPALVTTDENAAPVVAWWQVGGGRVLTYTGEADGQYAGDMARWEHAGALYCSLIRWASGAFDDLPGGVSVTQQVSDGTCRVQVHLDPEREQEPFTRLPTLQVLQAPAGGKPVARELAPAWVSPDVLEAEFALGGSDTALATVVLPGGARRILPPVCLPYSPEFGPPHPGKGRSGLAQMATISGGRETADVAEVWERLPRRPVAVELGPWLFVAAAACLLLEVLQRRTGLPFARWLRPRAPRLVVPTPAAPLPAPGAPARRQPVTTVAASNPPAPHAPPAGTEHAAPGAAPNGAEKPATGSILEALAELRRRGRGPGAR